MDRGSDDTAGAAVPASEAFQLLGNEIRTEILQQISEDGPCSFSTLAESSDAETTAGFAYHLRQLDGQYLHKRDDRYDLTAAGRRVVQAMAAGTFTAIAEATQIDLDDQCPCCGDSTLSMAICESVATVTCEECATDICSLSVPPGADTEGDSIPESISAFHRHRISTLGAGHCPDCGGPVDSAVERYPKAAESTDSPTVRASFDCKRCTVSFDCPLSLTVLDHSAVVSLYHEHGVEIRNRPVWNVGSEWRERCISTEPWCLLVSTRLGADVLDLYLDADCTVLSHERRTVAETDAPETETGHREGHSDDATA